MSKRANEQHLIERAPAWMDGIRADMYDEFYAAQSYQNKAVLDTWLAVLMSRDKFGEVSAKSLLASLFVFVHEHPDRMPKEQR